jgi:hypothetical protein
MGRFYQPLFKNKMRPKGLWVASVPKQVTLHQPPSQEPKVQVTKVAFDQTSFTLMLASYLPGVSLCSKDHEVHGTEVASYP